MARIVYGVQGEGRGHSSRSMVVIHHLLSQGHEVKIFASRKAYSYLKEFFPDVHRIAGLGFVFTNEKLDYLKTLQYNIERGKAAAATIKRLKRVLREFNPDIVITDFEPFTPLLKTLGRVPFVSIDHQHLISACSLEYPHQWHKDFLLARAVVDNIYWFADHYIISSFFFPPLKKDARRKTSLVGPLLRDEVLRARPSRGDHILLYVTTPTARRILHLVKRLPVRVIAYGFGKQGVDGNITYKLPSNNGFLRDLSSARAVITNGGYMLMSEALYLGKPVFALPLEHQFEQMMNAYYLEKEGFGLYRLSPVIDDLERFLDGLSYFRRNILRKRDVLVGNEKAFQVVDVLIAQFTQNK